MYTCTCEKSIEVKIIEHIGVNGGSTTVAVGHQRIREGDSLLDIMAVVTQDCLGDVLSVIRLRPWYRANI